MPPVSQSRKKAQKTPKARRRTSEDAAKTFVPLSWLDWKRSFAVTLKPHLLLINSLVPRIQDHDIESEQYHFLNVSLTFTAGRMLPADRESQLAYIVSIHPQAPLRAPGPAQDGATPNTVHHRPLTRGLLAAIQEGAEQNGADDGDVLLVELDKVDGGNPQPDVQDPLAEVSFATNVTEVSQTVPREELRSPDFIEVEEHPLFLHEVKRYPTEFFNATNDEEKLNSIAITMLQTIQQAAEQALKAFPEDNMMHEWIDVTVKVHDVECMYKAVFNGDGSIHIVEYGSKFKSVMTKARTWQIGEYSKRKAAEKGKGKGKARM
ncbi:hypothetical protein DAEQUDRAFT_758636 [Daedalea quercina L-15889]|uniref:Uncharacterized protein n=1 Tax=Daedalea quercina L-15889 TaxID=1314783 RepID=A0A165N814_9APHY|nr:hypothetical protein DAEQUDRAFT_758636 [Daedalea quercina L-15889]